MTAAFPALGEIVAIKYDPRIIVASFFVSFTGALATVELFHRRSNVTGWIKWAQLALCSVTLGSVGIWCMHYVGNRAIILGDGSAELQLFYSPGYTAASSFIPVVAVLIAFSVSDFGAQKDNFLRSLSLLTSGIIFGLAAVGMHYAGNKGISNYDISTNERFVGGAIAIACSAGVVVVLMLFRFPDFCLNHFIWRSLCSLVIAVGVSGMHFEASVGTTYRLKSLTHHTTSSRNVNITIASSMCAFILLVCVVFFMYSRQMRKERANRAKHVILASATFHPDGRIMVTGGKRLPCRMVSSKHNSRSFDDEFDESHPAFQWIYKAFHNWTVIEHWLQGMRQHLRAIESRDNPAIKKPALRSAWPLHSGDENFSAIFREGFCVAAADLANDLQEKVEQLGDLFDGVMTSGSVPIPKIEPPKEPLWQRLKASLSFWRRVPKTTPTKDADEDDVQVKAEEDNWGMGQVLFLTRKISEKDVVKYKSMNWRFMPISDVSNALAGGLQIPQRYVEDFLQDLSSASWIGARKPNTKKDSTVLALFGLLASVGGRKASLLIDKDKPDKLPSIDFWRGQTVRDHSKHLQRFDGLTLRECITKTEKHLNGIIDESFATFCQSFLGKIWDLYKYLGDEKMYDAIFSCKLFKVPSTNSSGQGTSYNVLMFHTMIDINRKPRDTPARFRFTDIAFFKCRIWPMDNTFSAKVHNEFAALLDSHSGGHDIARAQSSSSIRPLIASISSVFHPSTWSLSNRSIRSVSSRNANNRSFYQMRNGSASHNTSTRSLPAFGGVHVHEVITVEPTTPTSSRFDEEDIELGELAKDGIAPAPTTRGQAFALVEEHHTYLDAMFTIAKVGYAKKRGLDIGTAS